MHDPAAPDHPCAGREIALLTNPTAGRGKGARHRDAALAPAPRERASSSATCRDATPTRPPTWRAPASPTASRRWWCAAATAWSTSACRRWPAPACRSASSPPAPATTSPATSASRAPTRSPRRTAIIASRRRTIDLARSGDRYFVTVLAAGFDAIVNERANAMTWPRGQMRYNLATLAELRTFRRSPTPRARRRDGRSTRRCSSPSATAPPSAAGCGSPRAPCSTTGCSTSW